MLEGLDDAELLAHAAAVVADLPAQVPIRELEPLDELVAQRRRASVERGEVVEQVVAAHRVVERDAARQVARLAPDPDAVAGDVVAQHRRGPARRVEIAEEQADRRGLAGPVGPEEPEDLARLDADREPVEGTHLAAPTEGQAMAGVRLRQAGRDDGVHQLGEDRPPRRSDARRDTRRHPIGRSPAATRSFAMSPGRNGYSPNSRAWGMSTPIAIASQTTPTT